MSGTVIPKEQIKRMDKELVQLNKQISEFSNTLLKLQKYYDAIQEMKNHSKISKTYLTDIKNNVDKSKILENMSMITKTIDDLYIETENTKTKIKDINNFFERFRTKRTYYLDNARIFRFLSGFLEGFSEYFSFKPEFIGVVDLNKLAQDVQGKRDGTIIKIDYDNLPKLIEFAYMKGMNNFVIESHNLKLTFSKDYTVKIVAENEMIKKIDKIAKETNISFEA